MAETTLGEMNNGREMVLLLRVSCALKSSSLMTEESIDDNPLAKLSEFFERGSSS